MSLPSPDPTRPRPMALSLAPIVPQVPEYLTYDDFWTRYFFRAEGVAKGKAAGGMSFPGAGEQNCGSTACGATKDHNLKAQAHGLDTDAVLVCCICMCALASDYEYASGAGVAAAVLLWCLFYLWTWSTSLEMTIFLGTFTRVCSLCTWWWGVSSDITEEEMHLIN